MTTFLSRWIRSFGFLSSIMSIDAGNRGYPGTPLPLKTGMGSELVDGTDCEPAKPPGRSGSP